jgi:hypothetical protein
MKLKLHVDKLWQGKCIMTVTLNQLQVKARSQRFSIRHFPLVILPLVEINKAAALNESGRYFFLPQAKVKPVLLLREIFSMLLPH